MGLRLNPAGVKFSGCTCGISDHAQSLTMGCPGGLSEQMLPTAH